MKIKLQPVGTAIGLIFPQEVLDQCNLKAGDACALMLMENGIKLMTYDLESEQMKADDEQGEIDYLSTMIKVGGNTIGTPLSQDVLKQFDLKAGDMLPLVIMEDGIQLMAARKPTSQKLRADRNLKSAQEKVAYQSKDTSRRGGWWLDKSGRPMGWWLDDYAD